MSNKTEDAHLWRLLYWAIDGEIQCGSKVFRISNAYDFQEEEYKSLLKNFLQVPESILNRSKSIPGHSYKKLFMALMTIIDIDHLESFLE